MEELDQISPVSCDGIVLQFFQEIIDIIIVDLNVWHEHWIIVIHLNVFHSWCFSHSWNICIKLIPGKYSTEVIKWWEWLFWQSEKIWNLLFGGVFNRVKLGQDLFVLSLQHGISFCLYIKPIHLVRFEDLEEPNKAVQMTSVQSKETFMAL